MNATRILLLSCYELGHQPLSLAWPLAALRADGLDATAVDLAVEEFPIRAAQNADFVAISVPMHTAMRMGVDAARRVREVNPGAHVCFYGLYAWMNRDYLLHKNDTNGQPASAGFAHQPGISMPGLADSVVAGESEPVLVDLARAVLAGGEPSAVPGVTTATHEATPHLARLAFPLPERSTLPPLDRYARYTENGTAHEAGYVEASRGCLHTCRHCPVVPVYGGRFFVVPAQTVLADVRQQVRAGARHITFGDPDFLNGPGHAVKIARALHDEFPHVTFDFTTKVEHVLEQRHLMPEMAACGARFVVSAFESTSDRLLRRLHKGHTLADMDEALRVLRGAGIAPQPTWMPFTPWTTLGDYLHLLQWIRSRGLIPHVPAVQLSIRMLVPPGSALLDEPDAETWLGNLDAENFTYRWDHPDPRLDELHRQVTGIAERAGEDADPYRVFAAIERAAHQLAGKEPPAPEPPPAVRIQPPKLTEHWFC